VFHVPCCLWKLLLNDELLAAGNARSGKLQRPCMLTIRGNSKLRMHCLQPSGRSSSVGRLGLIWDFHFGAFTHYILGGNAPVPGHSGRSSGGEESTCNRGRSEELDALGQRQRRSHGGDSEIEFPRR